MFSIRILGIIKVKIKISSDKKFMRSISNLRDDSLKVNEKMRERNSFSRIRK